MRPARNWRARAWTPRPIPQVPLNGVVSDEEVQQLRERNDARFLAAREALGARYVCHTPINSRSAS